ncbi:hypothetical protein EHQ47_16835 [Leptospira bourretii]|uniref:hypothetical protein n=1 Tax=Leptospira bourretii TaxID=2484962 RepID=UPI001090DAD1|nr:hypothetical protein [Leptospira bourretii]TGL19762.1 hypothetical protein EHQ47_16835 [Leptospira bourretii]
MLKKIINFIISKNNYFRYLIRLKKGKLYSNNLNLEVIYNNDIFSFVNNSNYVNKFEILNKFTDEFADHLLNKTEFDKEFQNYGKIDKRNYIYTYCLSSIKIDTPKIINLIKEKEHTNFIKAYIIVHRIVSLPQIIYDTEILHTWFMNKEIRENELNVFSKENTILILQKLTKAKSKLINRHLKNLNLLWNHYPTLDSAFSKLVSTQILENEHLNEYNYNLAVKALQTNEDLITTLKKIKLKIDPFSRETQYRQWLIDIRKFDFIYKLISSELNREDPLRISYEKQEELLKKLRQIDNSL